MEASWGTKEFIDCGVEDKREAKSIAAMADRLLAHPELAFSSAVGSAGRKAAWRIFTKEEVDIGFGHYKQTANRCAGHKIVLVSQDTCDLSYTTHHSTEGLGDLGGGNGGVNLGLCLHTALALTKEGLPLGLAGQKVWAPVASGKGTHERKAPLETKENYCWVEGLEWAEQYLSHVEQVVLISDAESDFYEYLSAQRAPNIALLLRIHHLHRYILYQQQRVRIKSIDFGNAVKKAVYIPKAKKRKARTAQLQVSWDKIICPAATGKTGKNVDLWIVKAIETNPPKGEQPIEWYLFSTLPVGSEADALLMIDYYRKRWIIERFHLVLKSGMQVERLQFDCFRRLSNAIALLCIVAWQLLCLKHLAAQCADQEASLIFEPEQVEMLQLQSKKK